MPRSAPPGARIRLIGDGDLSAGIAAAVDGSGVHAVMGIGGAPEGVLTAAAMRCLGGEIYGRLVVQKPEHEERCRAMGITDFEAHLLGVGSRVGRFDHVRRDRRHRRRAAEGCPILRPRHRTSSVVMQNEPHQIRFIDTIHVRRTDDDLRIRF